MPKAAALSYKTKSNSNSKHLPLLSLHNSIGPYKTQSSAMDDVVSAPPPQTAQNKNHPVLPRRRNSISTPVVFPINLTLHHQSSSSSANVSVTASSASSSSSSGDFDLLSIKPISYISLKDLLPSTPVNSPKPKSPAHSSSSAISIRNRLVKQAAWAYLQPMSPSPDASARNFLHRVHSFFNRLNHALDWLLRTLRIRSSR